MSHSRAVPYFCPYCGETDLRPYVSETPPGEPGPKTDPGGWHCRACTRVFTAKLQGMVIHHGP